MAQMSTSRSKFDDSLFIDMANQNGISVQMMPRNVRIIRKEDNKGCNDWNATAHSRQAIESARDSKYGFRCRPLRAGQRAMIGLAGTAGKKESDLRAVHFSTLDFALLLSGGLLYVYEGGMEKGGYGSYAAGDYIELSINRDGKVEYRINGQTRYTSKSRPNYPLYMKICAYTNGELFKEVEWCQK
mmetsp:Transcript_34023/g.60166  ORF Transcript_34023/g.60166 Transcript_34023/m.60166 type:complete len:186 (+) Transcript_34023:65-622(+)